MHSIRPLKTQNNVPGFLICDNRLAVFVSLACVTYTAFHWSFHREQNCDMSKTTLNNRKQITYSKYHCKCAQNRKSWKLLGVRRTNSLYRFFHGSMWCETQWMANLGSRASSRVPTCEWRQFHVKQDTNESKAKGEICDAGSVTAPLHGTWPQPTPFTRTKTLHHSHGLRKCTCISQRFLTRIIRRSAGRYSCRYGKSSFSHNIISRDRNTVLNE